MTSGKGTLAGVACEKPLARNVAEAKRVLELVKQTGVKHGYLENQVFAPQVEWGRAILWARGAALTGPPYLARAAEEHSGPHMPWFWRGDLQGGGVLNDMMCHSALVVRHLLTKPGAPRSSLTPARITAHIASLKWSRPEYAKRLAQQMGKEVDYTKRPAEDFASLMIEFTAEEGHRGVAPDTVRREAAQTIGHLAGIANRNPVRRHEIQPCSVGRHKAQRGRVNREQSPGRQDLRRQRLAVKPRRQQGQRHHAELG